MKFQEINEFIEKLDFWEYEEERKLVADLVKRCENQRKTIERLVHLCEDNNIEWRE